jgi:hypothetical protein
MYNTFSFILVDIPNIQHSLNIVLEIGSVYLEVSIFLSTSSYQTIRYESDIFKFSNSVFTAYTAVIQGIFLGLYSYITSAVWF